MKIPIAKEVFPETSTAAFDVSSKGSGDVLGGNDCVNKDIFHRISLSKQQAFQQSCIPYEMFSVFLVFSIKNEERRRFSSVHRPSHYGDIFTNTSVYLVIRHATFMHILGDIHYGTTRIVPAAHCRGRRSGEPVCQQRSMPLNAFMRLSSKLPRR